MTPEEYKATGAKPKASKYRNVPTYVDGIRFASKLEAKRWGQLQQLERAGVITHLTRQPKFPLRVNGDLICRYVADFSYRENGELVVEDSKGVRTREFIIKKALLKSLYGYDVREVR